MLAATERLLQQGNSFGSISIEQLTKEAGMARGTFYLHFKDKGELVARLMDFFTEEVTSSFGTWTENAEIAEPKDVAAAVRGMVKSFKSHEAIIVAVRDTMPNDNNVADLYEKMMNTISEMAMESMKAIKQRGLSRENADYDRVGFALGWIVGLYCTYFIDRHNTKELNHAINALDYVCQTAIFSDAAREQLD
ncbi:TetR/AcrR family transcriptional regulator [Spongiibacter taiwanensis]|uniref:TetR/AcrR family transcriptional regulator n=1 Tax=Spongiibacter taiwanensis TaxID=1748242 RepID=UPI002034C24B|nr:TetR/AcrR family transcriptional regulator [Spongiibacter taiwanensis]USA41837.1 TetR/AcrR family transcriptional regulator [Spongiibacter taiwanensis]